MEDDMKFESLLQKMFIFFNDLQTKQQQKKMYNFFNTWKIKKKSIASDHEKNEEKILFYFLLICLSLKIDFCLNIQGRAHLCWCAG